MYHTYLTRRVFQNQCFKYWLLNALHAHNTPTHSIVVIRVKILQTEKIIEIQLVRPIEVFGKYKVRKIKSMLKHHCYCPMVCAPPKQLFVYKQRPFFITLMSLIGVLVSSMRNTSTIALTRLSKKISTTN